MKNTTVLTEEELKVARSMAAENAIQNYDFGDEYVDGEDFFDDGDVWSCKVYLATEDSEDTVEVSFTVFFKEGTAEVEDCTHDLI